MPPEILNLTPHPATRRTPSGVSVETIPPSGMVARLAETVTGMTDLGLGDHVAEIRYGQVDGLPDQQDGVYYLVPLLVAIAVKRADPTRDDLLVPYDQVRNEEGTVIGFQRFGRVA